MAPMATRTAAAQDQAVGYFDKTIGRANHLLGGRIPLPGFSYSQTLEDGDGVVSY